MVDLGLSWNVLDFGVSYYQSKQNADRLLVAQERRRKTFAVAAFAVAGRAMTCIQLLTRLWFDSRGSSRNFHGRL